MTAKKILVICGFATPISWWKNSSWFKQLKTKGTEIQIINDLEHAMHPASLARLRGTYDTIICHSQGFQHWYRSIIKTKKLILISPFRSFCQHDRMISRQLDRMIYRYKQNPTKVISDFIGRMNAEFSSKVMIPNLGVRRKEIYLTQLMQLAQYEVPIDWYKTKKVQQCHIIAFEKDPIVNPMRSKSIVHEMASTCDVSFTLVKTDFAAHFYDFNLPS